MQMSLICALAVLAVLGHSVAAEDEVVDIKMEKMEDGLLKLEFDAHGRKHKLQLRESRKQLTDIPLHPVGVDIEEFSEELLALKDYKMMRDSRFGASFAIRFDQDGEMPPRIHSGVFQLGNHEFSIAQETHTMARVSKNPLDKSRYQSDSVVSPGKERTKRSIPVDVTPINATVEILFIIDYELWMRFNNDLTELQLYFAHVAQMMDVSYSHMQNDDLTIRVDLAAMVVLMNDTTLPLLIIDQQFTTAGGGCGVDGLAVLNTTSYWLFNGGSAILPPYDHVMVMSGCDLYIDGSSGLLGIAWFETICNLYDSTSVVEVLGLQTEIAFTATHELGHSLGADHDGEVPGVANECPDENYIMAAYAGSMSYLNNRFLFTCCSQRSFYATIRKVNCLSVTSAVPNYPSTIDDQVENELPGEIYDADDQCFMAFGTAACAVNDSICLNLACVHPTDPTLCIHTLVGAADGTTCDTDKWCYQGACVATNSTPPPSNLNCNVRDCYGDERRCKVGAADFEAGRFLCYQNVYHCDDYIDCECGSDELMCNESIVCGGNMVGDSGEIKPPDHPANYPNNAVCHWNVRVDPGKVVEATFAKTAEVEDDGLTCSFDNINFIGGAGGYPTKLCGVINGGVKVVSEGNELNVTFTTDATVSYEGWQLNWVARCDGDDPRRSKSCGGPKVKCNEITKENCSSCDLIRQNCCNTCQALESPCVDTSDSKCTNIKNTCDPLPSATADVRTCKRKCKRSLRKCCVTCCRLFPELC